MEQIESRYPTERSLGLVAMDERARMLGGVLKIETRMGGGTRIIFNIPVDTKRGGDEPISYRSG